MIDYVPAVLIALMFVLAYLDRRQSNRDYKAMNQRLHEVCEQLLHTNTVTKLASTDPTAARMMARNPPGRTRRTADEIEKQRREQDILLNNQRARALAATLSKQGMPRRKRGSQMTGVVDSWQGLQDTTPREREMLKPATDAPPSNNAPSEPVETATSNQ